MSSVEFCEDFRGGKVALRSVLALTNKWEWFANFQGQDAVVNKSLTIVFVIFFEKTWALARHLCDTEQVG